MRVWVKGVAHRLTPAQSIGKGGEADIYDLGKGLALKLFKGPDHPDLSQSPSEQRAAVARLDQHQHKLAAFPRGLPPRVVVPLDLATDKGGQRVIGYTMRLVAGGEPLNLFADRTLRAAIPEERVVDTFRDLHQSVAGLHRAQVVIGDFNDLNVLVSGSEAHLVDADSFQFGSYPCPMFTLRFVDPLLCAVNHGALTLVRPHNPDSDWYAYAVLLLQSLLFVDPYGGLHRPAAKSRRVAEELRPLHRLTIFHPEVRYPKPARHFGVLPDDLLQELCERFTRDRRGPFPEPLLATLRFTRCTACGARHARPRCPSCGGAAPAAVREKVVVRGRVTATRVAHTRGRFLQVAVQDGELRFVSEEGGVLRREDGRVVGAGALDSQVVLRLQERLTLVGRGRSLEILDGERRVELLAADTVAGRTTCAANRRHRYWAQDGLLMRDGAYGPERIGEVLAGQTRLWAAERFGFGFYRAGELSVAFVFDAERAGLYDGVALPPIGGQLMHADCVLGEERAWLTLVTREAGRTVHSCVVVRSDGVVEATARAHAGDGSWLGQLGGRAAAGAFLFVAGDEGLCRVEVSGTGLVESKRFPDTEPFVDAASLLIAGRDGLYVISDTEIHLLRLR